MADVERTHSTPSVPPPPPPIEDSNYTVRYGNGADTYTNNHMADDESVEAQHVVYTFAEENGKDKVGRKKWACLLLSIAALLVTIIALGAVYGTQRRNRNKGQISAIESAASNATDASNVTEPVIPEVPDEDLISYEGNNTLNGTFVGNMTMGNVTNATEVPETVDPEATLDPSVSATFSGTLGPSGTLAPSGTLSSPASAEASGAASGAASGEASVDTAAINTQGTQAPTGSGTSSGTAWFPRFNPQGGQNIGRFGQGFQAF